MGIRTAGTLLARLGDAVTAHPGRVVAGWALVTLLAIPGLRLAHFSHDNMEWFPKRDPIRQALDLINDEFGGASSMEVIIYTPGENGLYDPDVMGRIEEAMRHTETLEIDGHKISQTFSLVDVVKETHRALNENRPEFCR